MGSRVVTFGWSGAWATRRAVSPAEIAVVPDSVELGAAVKVEGRPNPGSCYVHSAIDAYSRLA